MGRHVKDGAESCKDRVLALQEQASGSKAARKSADTETPIKKTNSPRLLGVTFDWMSMIG